MIIKFTIMGECKGKIRPRATRMGGFVRLYTKKEQLDYENLCRISYGLAIDKNYPNFEGFGDKPIYACVNIYKRVPKSTSKKKTALMLEDSIKWTTKPDIDNCLKSIFDGIQGLPTSFNDDNQIVSVIAHKYYAQTDFVDVWISDEPIAFNIPKDSQKLCF